MADTVDHTKLLELYTQVQILQERMKQQDKALALQAIEYDKHLASLNGEAGKLYHMQQSYIPREVYEQYIKDAAIKHEKDVNMLNDKIAANHKEIIDRASALQIQMEGRVSKKELWLAALAIIGLVLTVVGLFMR